MVGSDPTTSRAAYQPALDGVRGFAVALVLLFHGGFSWMTGGYVGVSVFFTLSGFLITGLLLTEHDRDGSISLRSFYVRRLRRLMPASLLCLAAVSVAASLGEFGGLPNVRRDILAALFQVANWNALANGTGYADLIARTAGQLGPVDHFWSLSVEEQFYWVWPLVGLFGLARLRRRGGSARVALAVTAALAVAVAPVIAAVWGANAAYWATPARLGEILVGAALAAFVKGRTVGSRAVPWMGLGGLSVIVAASVMWPRSGGPAYGGWLGVFSLASAALILGLQVPGPLQRSFSVAPLTHLGRISYGVYLYHWPLFAALTPQRLGLSPWWLFAVRIAATLVVAELSYHLLEQPVRHGMAPPWRVAWGVVGSIAALSVLVLAIVPGPEPAFGGSTDVPRSFAPPSAITMIASSPAVTSTTTASSWVPATTSSSSEPTTSSTAVPLGPATVLLVGDSTAVALSEGLFRWANAHPGQLQVASLAEPGCGLIREGSMLGDDDEQFKKACREVFSEDLPALLRTAVPDVVMVMVTLPDVVARQWSENEGPLRPGDPRFAERVRRDYDAFSSAMRDVGVARMLWVVPPPPSARWMRSFVDPITHTEWATFVAIIEGVAASDPTRSTVVQLDDWMRVNEPADGSMRPDGLHLTPTAADLVMRDFFGAELLSAVGR